MSEERQLVAGDIIRFTDSDGRRKDMVVSKNN